MRDVLLPLAREERQRNSETSFYKTVTYYSLTLTEAFSPPLGVAKLTVGALGPAAGVDVINPGGSNPSGRRIESVGSWDSCKVPDSKTCMGHCVS